MIFVKDILFKEVVSINTHDPRVEAKRMRKMLDAAEWAEDIEQIVRSIQTDFDNKKNKQIINL